jgi:hypothetical protein
MIGRAAALFLTISALLFPGSLLATTGEAEDEAERDERVERLEKRVEELEAGQDARDSATRSVISQALSDLGSNINNVVTFGGTFEVLSGWTEDLDRTDEAVIRLNTAELDFEIRPSDWLLGSLIIEYDDGLDNVFTTTNAADVSVDRINVDTAFLRIGNPERFWPFALVGRQVVPFGISTGDPVADVLTIEDPLTVEVFEMKEDAILIGFEYPTPPLGPQTPIPAPPKVRPLVIAPLFAELARLTGYRPLPAAPPRQEYVTPTEAPAPFTGGVYLYNGDTFNTDGSEGEFNSSNHIGATLGYRTRGACSVAFCVAWSFEVDVDWNNSIFDTETLESEYRFLFGSRPGQGSIGFEPGMAVSTRASLGPVALVSEWNGALEDTTFFDDAGIRRKVSPSAWQVSLAYQFDWNRWVEVVGAQGTYIAIGYSESDDLEGVLRLVNGNLERVGFVPESRFLVSVGEWVLPNLRLAVEYSRVDDYSRSKGGTGRSADGVIAMLTFEW